MARGGLRTTHQLLGMDTVSNIGLMGPITRANGLTIKLKGKALSGTPKEMFTGVNLRTTWQMDMASIRISMGQSIKVSSEMMSRKAMVRKSGSMAPSMLELTKMVWSMATVSINGPTTASIRAIGKIIRYQVMANIPGMTVVPTKATGRTTICTDKESTNGLMDVNTRVNISTTRNMVMEFTPIPMADLTKVTGQMANSMVRALS
jgi:hypothetical protein